MREINDERVPIMEEVSIYRKSVVFLTLTSAFRFVAGQAFEEEVDLSGVVATPFPYRFCTKSS